MSVPDTEVVLDISRLLSRVRHATPTGIDRVEMAYATYLPERVSRLAFAAVHPLTRSYGRLDSRSVARFLDLTRARWDGRAQIDAAGVVAQLTALRPRRTPPLARGDTRVFVQPSPNNLDRASLIGAILKREGARFVPLVHDLIPITHPEYARPDGAALHLRRVATIDRFADGIVANSQATLDALTPLLTRRDRPSRVALLGHEAIVPVVAHKTPPRPYFLCIGTIEPRKNHALLLNLWRRMAEREAQRGARGPLAVPRLILVGRRGWENENVVDMLERCPSVHAHVKEAGRVSDVRLATLLRGARALLLPSYAEGFGLPVADAIACATPVICSDLPALREAGGDVPDYLDPLDGLGWLGAIDDYAGDASPLAAAQARRGAAWRPAQWNGHFTAVTEMIAAVARG